MTTPPKHFLKNVRINRIAIVKHPAVTDSEVVLMKSVDGDAETTLFERLWGRLQQKLAINQPPTQESPDMKLEEIKLEDIEKSRPDLVEAILKKAKPAEGVAAGAAAGSEDVAKSDPFKALRESLDALKTELAGLKKGIEDRVEKLEKADKPAPVDLAPLTKSIEDINGKIADLAKAKQQGLLGGEGKEGDLKKSTFGSTFKSLRRKASR